MQAVILAGGKSTRTYPLTLTKPKPLLKILNKTILEHLLDELLKCNVEEAIIIVGYKKEMIIEKFGDEYKGMKLIYVEQKEQLGTMHALLLTKNLIKGRFMVLYGDDLLNHKDLKEGLKYDNSMLVLKTKTPERFGIALVNEQAFLKDIIEKPKEFVGDLASVGGFVFEKDFLDCDLVKEEGQTEYFIPTRLREYCKDTNVKVLTIQKYWLPTGYPWDLINASEVLIEDLKEDIKGEVEEGATIKGPIKVGEGTLIKSGAYIEGPIIIGDNCTIGPNCYIRKGTVIGNNCKIGNAVEIKNSIIMNNTNVGHLSYIGDTIIGEGSNMGAGTITANLRHEKDNVLSMVKDELVDTGRRKLGAIMADNVKTGIHTSIYPGRKLSPGVRTRPGTIVQKDLS